MSRDEGYVLDMLTSAAKVLASVGKMSKSEFLADEDKVDATIRRLEMLGEAAKLVSEEFKRSHPEVDWSGPARMRDRLIHQYRRVDVEEIWQVVLSDLPTLIAKLEPLVPKEEE